MKLTQNQTDWLRRMQEEWMSIMEPFSLEGGKVFTPIPKLGREHLANARLVPSRDDLLEEFPRGGIGGEVGTQHGYFAKKLYEVVQPRELHLFDLSFDKMEPTWPLVDEERKRIFMHVGDSSRSLAQFPEGYFDWLYIDADHSYEGVSRDIAEAVRIVKGSGFLAFNDFTYWSPVEAMPYGVAHAVCDLCINGDWEITFVALEPWMYCDVVIRRRNARRAGSSKEEAALVLRGALARLPDSVRLQEGLAMMLAAAGNVREAAALLEAATRQQPENAGLYWLELGPPAWLSQSRLAQLLERCGRLEEALAAVRRAAELGPEEAWLWSHLGGLLTEAGELDEAEAALQRALALAPDDALSHYRLAQLLERRGRLEEALAAVRRAAELDGANEHVQDCLASLLAEAERKAKSPSRNSY